MRQPPRSPGSRGSPDAPDPGPPLISRRVEPDDAGARIDTLLSGWLDEPRNAVQRRLAAGEVLLDGRPPAKSARLRAGQEVVVLAPAAEPPAPPPPPVPVRYDDAHLLVVAKPAGMVVHAGAGTRAPTLVDALRAMEVPLAAGPDPHRPGIVHRLDRGTSGLLVVAKTEAARAGLVALLSRHEVDRRYWVLVEGVPAEPRATVDAPIARSPVRRTAFAVMAGGRRAVTSYDLIEDLRIAAVLETRLQTGRTHQVRVHLSAIGHPVAGDSVYGASSALADRLGLTRPALHARHLGFRHPVTGVTVSVEEPVPAELLAARDLLRREASA